MNKVIIKLTLAYVVVFPLLGILLGYLGLEHVAYFAAFGAIFAQTVNHIIYKD